MHNLYKIEKEENCEASAEKSLSKFLFKHKPALIFFFGGGAKTYVRVCYSTFDANSWTICCRLDIFLVYSESFNSNSAISGLQNENWIHIRKNEVIWKILLFEDHRASIKFRPMEQFCRHIKHLNSKFGKDLNWKYLQGVNWLYLNICREKFALLRKNLGLFLSNWIYELHILLQLLINTTTVQIVLSTLC